MSSLTSAIGQPDPCWTLSTVVTHTMRTKVATRTCLAALKGASYPQQLTAAMTMWSQQSATEQAATPYIVLLPQKPHVPKVVVVPFATLKHWKSRYWLPGKVKG
jgi:hypothetical protein